MEDTLYDNTTPDNIKPYKPAPTDPDPLYIQTTVAIGKTLIKGLPRMKHVKMKLFFVLLEHINWRELNTDWQEFTDGTIIVIDNQLVKKRLGWNIKNDTTVASRVRNYFKEMVTECIITIQTEEETKKKIPLFLGVYGNKTEGDTEKKIPLFLDVYGNKNYTAVAINPIFRNQIIVPRSCGEQYFQFNLEDIMGFHSLYSIYLYMELLRRQTYAKPQDDLDTICIPSYNNLDTFYVACKREIPFSTKTLKGIMGMDIKKYTSPITRKDAEGNEIETDHFARLNFEKNVLEEALEEISHSHAMELFPPLAKNEEDENVEWVYSQWYSKRKYCDHVKNYYIHFQTITTIFSMPYGRYVNNARLEEIAQGFAPESKKKKYLAWLDGIKKAANQAMGIPNETDDADNDKS